MSLILRILAPLVLGLLAAGPAGAQSPVERGKYLVSIMDCTGCHTTGALAGKPDPARFLAGSDIGFEMPGLGIFYPRNLTPDRDTGLGTWTEADIVRAIRTGQRPDGRTLAPIMPWPSYASLTDADAQSIAAYLKSLSPVRHEVPAPVAAGEPAKAPYLTMAQPRP